MNVNDFEAVELANVSKTMCGGCHFEYNFDGCKEMCSMISCLLTLREDGKEIIWVKKFENAVE